jgi:hypothetical protein
MVHRATRPGCFSRTMTRPEALVTDGEYRRRFAAAFAVSLLLHTGLILLIVFEALGTGGGIGIGVGPGIGLGAGGGLGLGERGRQIFALSDVEADAQRPTSEPFERELAMLLKPQRSVPATVEPLARLEAKELPVVPLAARPRQVAVLRNVRGRLAKSGAGIGGIGGGGGGGFGVSFGHYVGDLRRRGLDVVIVLDSTGSMQNIIDETKDRMVGLVRSIQKLVPTARVGAVAFRDRPDGSASVPRAEADFVVKWSDLTFNGPKVQAFLSRVTAASGGDWEEAVREGLEAAIGEMSWRSDAKKVIILVGSSPPHAEDGPVIARLAARFRNNRQGTISTIDVTDRLHEEHERRIHRWLWGTEPSEISPLPDFYAEVQDSYRAIASAGGGEMLRLETNDTLVRHLLVLTFGTAWEKELARIARGM